MKKKKITMQYIADKLGISKVSVFKALHDKDGVSPDLKERIEHLAQDYGYQVPKNMEEDNLITAKNIVIFCDNKYFDENKSFGEDNYFDESDISYFYLGIYKSISKQLIKHNCTATLYTVRKKQSYHSIKEILDKKQFDGIILMGDLEHDFVKIVEEIRIPKVFVDSYSDNPNSDSVVIENFYATYKLTRHLIDYGHKRIGYVGTIGVTPSINDRYLGYYKALLENGLSMNREWIINDRSKSNNSIEMNLPPKLPTAFVCNCDNTAYKIVMLLKNKGVRVPEDVSIVSFDNDILSTICEPKLTTVDVDIEKIATKAVEIILFRVGHHGSEKPIVELVNGKIIYRDSVVRVKE